MTHYHSCYCLHLLPLLKVDWTEPNASLFHCCSQYLTVQFHLVSEPLLYGVTFVVSAYWAHEGRADGNSCGCTGGEHESKTLRQLQAEQDDEDRFQADLERALQQSLGREYALYPRTSGIFFCGKLMLVWDSYACEDSQDNNFIFVFLVWMSGLQESQINHLVSVSQA
jgi:hypothetical protein